ncbi:restriction endonuclease subunit S [Vibrio harveyi]|uniref:restriction endonuclease subunit S n=1 Tax=Vibrio harveyi TaxID=669 RepID=UPI0038CD94C1
MTKVKYLPLTEVTTLVTDGKHGDCKNEENSGFYFLSSKDLRDGKLHYDKPRQINYTQFAETHRRTNLEFGDILLANTGASIGRVGIAQVDERIPNTTFQKSISVIKADRNVIDNRYLYYFFRNNSSLLSRLGGGAAQPNLLLGDIRKIQVRVPERATQLKISKVLTDYDELIENNSRRIEILEEMALSLYREWFVNFRYPDYENNLGADGYPKLVDSPLGQIPEGWEVKTLKDVLELAYGKALKKADRKGGDVAVYGSGGIGGYHDKSLVTGPCIIVGRKGNVGKTFWVDPDCWPIDTVFYVKSDFSKYYLYYNLLHQTFFNSDAAVPGLNRESAYSNKIIIPSDDLVVMFNDFVKPIFEQRYVLAKANNNLKQQRDMLLPKLISGDIEL